MHSGDAQASGKHEERRLDKFLLLFHAAPVNVGAFQQQVVQSRLGVQLQAALAGPALAQPVSPVAAAHKPKEYGRLLALRKLVTWQCPLQPVAAALMQRELIDGKACHVNRAVQPSMSKLWKRQGSKTLSSSSAGSAHAPGRQDAAVQIARQHAQEGQPPGHVACVLLEEHDSRLAGNRLGRPVLGPHEPRVQLDAVLCRQPHVLHL